jgi:hypothetical protein
MAGMGNYKWLLSVMLVVLLVSVPVSGQGEKSGDISPLVFVPLDIGGFVTLDIQRFQELDYKTKSPAVWKTLYKEFSGDFTKKELEDLARIDLVPSIRTVTFVFFQTFDSDAITEEFAVIFKLSKGREELLKDLASLDSLEAIPSFGAYGDIPLMRSDPAIDDPPLYLAFPDNHHVVLGYKHEVKKILAIYRRERSNILAHKEVAALLLGDEKPVFQSAVFLTDRIIAGLKEMELPMDLTGAELFSICLDSQSLALRLLISDPAESAKIVSYWKLIKGTLSSFAPKSERENALFQLSTMLAIESSPKGVTLRFPADTAMPEFETLMAAEMRLEQDSANAMSTIDNIKLVADQVEVYLLDHTDLPTCRSLVELKRKVPRIFLRSNFKIPETDGWGNPLLFVSDGKSYAIASGGSDNVFKGWDQEPGEYSAQRPEDFKMDYIFKDGMFLVGPLTR